MRRLFSAMLSLLGLALLAYVWFFVPLGQRTMHQHAQRIAGTEPARELGSEAREASERLVGHVEGEWRSRYAPDGGLSIDTARP